MRIIKIFRLFSLLFLFYGVHVQGQSKLFTQENLKFPRERMELTDVQVLLFNGRGFVCPREFSMTSFSNPRFFPTELPDYDFFINIIEEETGIEIRDDVPLAWREMEYAHKGYDPLGCNFRSWAPYALVTQDEVWYPNLYTRTGMFHKRVKNKLISFSMKTEMCVSSEKDEVYLSVELYNRDEKPLSLTFVPHQIVGQLPLRGQEGSPEIKIHTPFEISSDQLRVSVSSDITDTNEKGFKVNLLSKSTSRFYFAISFDRAKNKKQVFADDLSTRFNKAQYDIQAKLLWAAERMPSVQTENKQLNDLYYRCLLSVLMCRYERNDFLINPFWTVGTWPFTISWDNSFAADIITMLDPESMKKTLQLNFSEGKMKRTYISYAGADWDQLYIQEPFAQQTMLNAYLKQTGDLSILSLQAGDATIYEWMKRWARELHDNYGRKSDGLIDVGNNTELIIEIRTDGYDHIVPVVNILTLDLYKQLSQWAIFMKDKEGVVYEKWATQLEKSIKDKLWNEEKGWYDNLYADGSSASVWTYHLFDLLGSPNVDNNKRMRLISHIKDGIFLGKFGCYSIARNDTLHWDRIDGDWGGGGQYAGMPGRIARNLYQSGYSALGWEILKRYARYTDFFPYMSQNPSTDKPTQDISSMPLQIASGAGAEAVLFGIFGLDPQLDGTLKITPRYHPELGKAVMRSYHFRGKSYDVEIDEKKFRICCDGVPVLVKPIGETAVIK